MREGMDGGRGWVVYLNDRDGIKVRPQVAEKTL